TPLGPWGDASPVLWPRGAGATRAVYRLFRRRWRNADEFADRRTVGVASSPGTRRGRGPGYRAAPGGDERGRPRQPHPWKRKPWAQLWSTVGRHYLKHWVHELRCGYTPDVCSGTAYGHDRV